MPKSYWHNMFDRSDTAQLCVVSAIAYGGAG